MTKLSQTELKEFIIQRKGDGKMERKLFTADLAFLQDVKSLKEYIYKCSAKNKISGQQASAHFQYIYVCKQKAITI